MKTVQSFFTKNIISIVIGVFVVMSIALTWSIIKTNNLASENVKLKQQESILSNNLIAAKDTMQFWKDQYSNSKSEIKLLTATSDMLKNQYSDIYNRYLKLIGKVAKNQEMIAYLQTQIVMKDQIIADLKAGSGNGSYILNDSTIAIDEGKVYDTNNYYSVTGTVLATIIDNKIKAGKIDLTTTIGIGVDFGISRDKKTGMASIVSSTAFPAKVSMSGITRVEQEINKKPSSYLGLGFVIGYGATLEQQPQLKPFLGVAAYVSPRWLTIKIRNR